jgi:hypothetical protein
VMITGFRLDSLGFNSLGFNRLGFNRLGAAPLVACNHGWFPRHN